MNRRTRDDWRQIIEQQQNSDLTISGFCRQHKLTTSNFYKYRQIFQANTTRFVKTEIEVSSSMPAKKINLRLGHATLTLDDNCDPAWLAKLMLALQP